MIVGDLVVINTGGYSDLDLSIALVIGISGFTSSNLIEVLCYDGLRRYYGRNILRIVS